MDLAQEDDNRAPNSKRVWHLDTQFYESNKAFG